MDLSRGPARTSVLNRGKAPPIRVSMKSAHLCCYVQPKKQLARLVKAQPAGPGEVSRCLGCRSGDVSGSCKGRSGPRRDTCVNLTSQPLSDFTLVSALTTVCKGA